MTLPSTFRYRTGAPSGTRTCSARSCGRWFRGWCGRCGCSVAYKSAALPVYGFRCRSASGRCTRTGQSVPPGARLLDLASAACQVGDHRWVMARPHRAMGQLAPAQAHTRPPGIDLAGHRICRKQVLSGLTHEYYIAVLPPHAATERCRSSTRIVFPSPTGWPYVDPNPLGTLRQSRTAWGLQLTPGPVMAGGRYGGRPGSDPAGNPPLSRCIRSPIRCSVWMRRKQAASSGEHPERRERLRNTKSLATRPGQ